MSLPLPLRSLRSDTGLVLVTVDLDENPTAEPGEPEYLWYLDVRVNGRRIPPLGGYESRAAAVASLNGWTDDDLAAWASAYPR